MKKSIVLFMVATILVTTVFFTQNVKADNNIIDTVEVNVPYNNYIVIRELYNDNYYYSFFVNADLENEHFVLDRGPFSENTALYLIGNFSYFKPTSILSLDYTIEHLKLGDLDLKTTSNDVLACYIPNLNNVEFIYASHDVFLDNELVFQKTPLATQSPIPTVGGMKAGEIVQTILTQKIYLIPSLIILVVALVGFRKALRTLFQVLKRV